MAVKGVLVCDVCGKDGDVQSYRIVFPDELPWETDLCRKDSVHLEQFRGKGWGTESRGRGRRRQFEVTSLEEVQERVKPKARKRP